jgi:Domain of unknown function (DUF222)
MQDARPAPTAGAGVPGEEMGGAVASQGLAWSWELDFEALQAALDAPAPWNRPASAASASGASAVPPASAPAVSGSASAPSAVPPAPGSAAVAGRDDATAGGCAEEEDQEAVLAAMQADGRSRVVPAAVVAGRIAECLPAGPGLAAWLARAQAEEVEDGALAGVAASFRRMASWAQAGELAMVAQIASRAAAREEKIGVDDQGRPAAISVSACAEVSLGLVMTQCAASWWTDLAVTLRWRLRQTGIALAQGRIDLSRARLIAEATGLLGDQAARAVQEQVLPRAGLVTTGQLRAELRRAVIAADPQGAERRREQAERRAKVSLYGDDDGTATLSGSGLPVIQACAAMARITAMARALKASGATGPMDLHRAQVFLGLLLGTLPYIPPAPDAPPDSPPRPDIPLPPDIPPPGDDDGAGGGSQGEGPMPQDPGFSGRRRGACPDATAPGSRQGAAGSRQGAAGQPDGAPGPAAPIVSPEDVPWPGDQDAPCDEGDPFPDGATVSARYNDGEGIDDLPGSAPVWPPLPVVVPPAFTRPGSGGAGSAQAGTAQAGTGRPAGGLLDVTLPWPVLAGRSCEPGHLGRIGPVTASQARALAEAAAADPAAQWRVIVTSAAGQALAVTRLPRRTRARAGPGRDEPGRDEPGGPSPGSGLVGRVTLTISQDTLATPQGHDPPGGIAAAALLAAATAIARAQDQASADAAAGGCAHASQSPAYRPPPRLHEYITARDLTCRFPTCRQPAWRGDLDHTTPWPRGRTCRCNLGGLCRTHHQLKQHPGWELTQATAPGTFTWTTPAGRTYTTTPDAHPA